METPIADMAGAPQAGTTGVSGNATNIIEATEIIVKVGKERLRGKVEMLEEATTINPVTEIGHRREEDKVAPDRHQRGRGDAHGHDHHQGRIEDAETKTAGKTGHQSQARKPFWQNRSSQKHKPSLSESKQKKMHKIAKSRCRGW